MFGIFEKLLQQTLVEFPTDALVTAASFTSSSLVSGAFCFQSGFQFHVFRRKKHNLDWGHGTDFASPEVFDLKKLIGLIVLYV